MSYAQPPPRHTPSPPLFAATGAQESLGVAVNSAGDVLLAGRFDAPIDLGGGPLDNGGGYAFFVAALGR